MDKKKIFILGPAHPFRGGIATFNERLASEFQNEGHEVEIITFTLQYPKILFPGKTQFSEEDAPVNLKIKRLLSSVNPISWLKTGKYIRNQKPDLLIIRYWLPFMGPSLGFVARKVKKNKHTRIVGLLDNVIPHEKRFGDKAFTKYFLKPIDAFLTMSDSVSKDLRSFEKEKPCEYSPHPLFDNFGEKVAQEEAINHLKLRTDKKYILFFGLVRAYKGLDLLLDGFEKLAKENQEIDLIVAGEFYEDEQKYIAWITERKLEDRIIISNEFVRDDEVKYFFAAADIVAQPYKTATQSGVTQIGYHFEVPMLVTNVGGLPEMIPDNKVGYVVEPNGEAIYTALRDYFSSNKKTLFQENLKDEKKKYAWNKLTAKLLDL